MTLNVIFSVVDTYEPYPTRFHVHLDDNVQGEPVFSVMVAGWLCEKSSLIQKVEDVKPVL
jgi:hypothetical protein